MFFFFTLVLKFQRESKTKLEAKAQLIPVRWSVIKITLHVPCQSELSAGLASGSSGSGALMLACSGTTQSPHSLWAAAQLVHTAPVIYLDPDSLKDC